MIYLIIIFIILSALYITFQFLKRKIHLDILDLIIIVMMIIYIVIYIKGAI